MVLPVRVCVWEAVMELEFTDADDRTVQLKREGSEVVLYLDGDFGFAGPERETP